MAGGIMQRFKGRIKVHTLFWGAGASVTANHSPGGQSGGTKVGFGTYRLTVANANDSITLPPATGSGGVVRLINTDTSNSMQVYGTSPDTINLVATGTGVAQAAGLEAEYRDSQSGKWTRFLGA